MICRFTVARCPLGTQQRLALLMRPKRASSSKKTFRGFWLAALLLSSSGAFFKYFHFVLYLSCFWMLGAGRFFSPSMTAQHIPKVMIRYTVPCFLLHYLAQLFSHQQFSF